MAFAASSPSGSHDVSILIDVGAGVGRYRGSQPRAKTSMIIMRAPQRGQVQGCTRGSSGVAVCSRLHDTGHGPQQLAGAGGVSGTVAVCAEAIVAGTAGT